ncbi:MAG: hypothetical protein JXR83_03325, partial [Deltaproteobacteria bacterium]|nr:hypothetical protein [Deltaproteobacteria bacterium]
MTGAGCTGRDRPSAPSAGSPDEIARAEIGPQGGKIDLGDDVSLEIPAGALAQRSQIAVSRLAEATDLSSVFRFEPEGMRFAAPARLSIRVDGEVPPLKAARVGWRTGTRWVALATDIADIDGERWARASISHFSDFGAVVRDLMPLQGRGTHFERNGIGLDLDAEADVVFSGDELFVKVATRSIQAGPLTATLSALPGNGGWFAYLDGHEVAAAAVGDNAIAVTVPEADKVHVFWLQKIRSTIKINS